MAGRIPQSFIDELIARVDIVDVINARVPLKRKGKEYLACCPFHNETTPSFTVSQPKQFYHCFGCGAHGTAIGFLMEYEHLEFVEAIETLAADQHLEVPREAASPEQQARQARHQQLYACLQQASEWFRRQLPQHPRAVDYLKKRGLSGEIARKYHIGYAPEGWDRLQRQLAQSFDTSLLLEAGLLTKNDAGKTWDRFRDRIIFPIFDNRGRAIGFGGRVLDQGEPKYLNSPETPVFHKGHELYGLYQVKQSVRQLDRLLVVEGYMDVVALSQHGVDNAVAALGTATTGEQVQKLFRNCHEIIFCYDGDQAGRKAAWRALENTLPVLRDGMVARFLFLPEGEDPDSYIRKHGHEAFIEQMQQAQTLSTFFFERLRQQTAGDNQEGRAQLAQRAAPLIRRMHNGVYRDLLLDELARQVRLDRGRLEKQVLDEAPPPKQATRPRPSRMQQVKNTKIRVAMALLIQFPELAASCDLPADFAEAITRGLPLLYELWQTIRQNPGLGTAALLERYRNHPHEAALNQLAVWSAPEIDNEKTRAADFTHIIARLQLENRYETLRQKAEQGGLSAEEQKELLSLSGSV